MCINQSSKQVSASAASQLTKSRAELAEQEHLVEGGQASLKELVESAEKPSQAMDRFESIVMAKYKKPPPVANFESSTAKLLEREVS